MGKSRGAKVPVHGSVSHNSAFLHAIGGLMVKWANTESVFLALLQALVNGGESTAAIIWDSQRITRNRLDLIGTLVREQITALNLADGPNLINDVDHAIKHFAGFTRTRTFFAHAMYNYDPQTGALISATRVSVDNKSGEVRTETKNMDASTLNEIANVLNRMPTFNRHLWTLVQRLETALEVRHVRLPPELLADQQSQVPRHPKDDPQGPQGPPSPSQA